MDNLARKIKPKSAYSLKKSRNNTARRKPRKASRRISLRQNAAITLSHLVKCAREQRACGEVLNYKPWLKVLANVLSAAPAGLDGNHSMKSAPMRLGLSEATLGAAAFACGFKVHDLEQEIADQVASTRAWRGKESERMGTPHYAMMSMDTMGELLGITDEIRFAAKAWNVGTFGGSREARQEAARQRDRLRHETTRRQDGAMPREQYEANSLSQTKPWEEVGISRRTWERRRAANVASSSGTNKGSELVASPSVASASGTNKAA